MAEKVRADTTLAFDVSLQPLVRHRQLTDVDLGVPEHIDAYVLGPPTSMDVLALNGEDELCR